MCADGHIPHLRPHPLAVPSCCCLPPAGTAPAGTRVLQLPLTGLLLQQPPLALLLEHAVQSALLSSNALYCRSVLLQDPLSRRRMARAWAALDWLPQLMPLSSLRGSGAEPDGGLGQAWGAAWPPTCFADSSWGCAVAGSGGAGSR